MYQHLSTQGEVINLPVGKIVCVGLNYHDHVEEMGSKLNDDAVLFMKPNTALVDLCQPFDIPTQYGDCHNEAEIAILIQAPLTLATESDCEAAIWGYGIGLDLTLREVQKQLKALGRPWERAKAFDGSAPLSPFIPKAEIENPNHLTFSLSVNDQLRQQGNSLLMIRPIIKLLSIISEQFTLLPGDVVFTGTPAGVAALNPNDKLSLTLEQYTFTSQVTNV